MPTFVQTGAASFRLSECRRQWIVVVMPLSFELVHHIPVPEECSSAIDFGNPGLDREEVEVLEEGQLFGHDPSIHSSH